MINATQARNMANENSGVTKLLKEFDSEITAAAVQGKFEIHKHMEVASTEDKILQATVSALEDNGYKVEVIRAVRDAGAQALCTVLTLRVYWG